CARLPVSLNSACSHVGWRPAPRPRLTRYIHSARREFRASGRCRTRQLLQCSRGPHPRSLPLRRSKTRPAFTHPSSPSCETIRETDGLRRRVMNAHWLFTDRVARWLVFVAVAMVLLLPADAAQTPARGPLEVPARTLPVPTTV